MLDLNDETGDLVLIENALVVPPPANGRGKWQPSGVLDSKGRFVENSISWSSTTLPVNTRPPMPDPGEIAELPGTHIFGGISYGHFGHFIAESLTRIWALDELRGKADGFVYTPKVQMRDNNRPFEIYRDLTRAMGIDIPMISAAQPLRVQRLYVPRQGFGLGDLMAGSRKYRDYIRRHAGHGVQPKGAEKIYISRSLLPRDRGGLIGEWKLEKYLQAEGYALFHPQKETKQDQLAQYKAARKIIAVDCSPLHLVGYVGNKDQQVGILTRRSMAFAGQFVTQLSQFHGIDCRVVDCLVNDWLPGSSNRPSRSSFGEVSLSDMYRQLKAAGLIEGDEEWQDLTLEERNDELWRIEKLHEQPFHPLKPDDSFVSSRKAEHLAG